MADDHAELQDIQWESRVENINIGRNVGGGKGLKAGGENGKDFGD